MAIMRLGSAHTFPNPMSIKGDIVAVGGDLDPKRLLLAYESGIFPWPHEGKPLLWFSPNIRMVINPKEIHMNRTLQKAMKKSTLVFRLNTCFEAVMRQCAQTRAEGTWITEEMIKAYVQLHHMGYAHSIEAFLDQRLVGGFYGIWLGALFCGESMFSLIPNASKLALIWFCKQFQNQIHLIDCQIESEHLKKMGGKIIHKEEYLTILKGLKSNLF